MKALTLTQPYVTLVAIGAKRIETRSWPTRYRGPLAIHAATSLRPIGGVAGLRRFVRQEPFYAVLKRWGDRWGYGVIGDPSYYLPFGKIVATCTLVACRAIAQCVSLHQGGGSGVFMFDDQFGIPLPDEPERSFGDYTPGRFAWQLVDVTPLDRPVAARGAYGLWNWTEEPRCGGPDTAAMAHRTAILDPDAAIARLRVRGWRVTQVTTTWVLRRHDDPDHRIRLENAEQLTAVTRMVQDDPDMSVTAICARLEARFPLEEHHATHHD
jgi:hypothetical protein